MSHGVKEIQFTIKLDNGKTVVVEMIRKTKVDELMTEDGTLGDFLRAIVVNTRNR